MKSVARRVLLIAFAAAVIGAIALGLRPAPVEADLAKVVRGVIRETVDQDGKTRIRERYIVSAPLAGRLLRIGLDPGDPVEAGKTVVASIEPRDPELLDTRAVLQAEANVRAAEAKLKRTTPMLEEAVAAQEYAETELQRLRDARIRSPGAVTESQVDSALMEYRMRSALVRSARHGEEIARFELDQARAALLRSRPQSDMNDTANVSEPADEQGESDAASNKPSHDARAADDPAATGYHFIIRSPINGRVLRVFQESSGVVTAGTNLLELGDPTDLEVEIDVLSREAVEIKPNAAVLLEHWGGHAALHGRVRLVEPSAFTKISTLGVEEQRVNVIVDLIDPPQQRLELGDGFRVEARIVIAEATDVLKTPTSSLFRVGDEWAVFRVENGLARQRMVKLGVQNGLEAEVVEGLEEGDQVVTHPGDNITDGVKVKPR
jgi:HlyD family secretion protein